MGTIVTDRGSVLLARYEDDDRVFEVSFDSLEPTDVTLRFRRDGERVGSIYNDDGTTRTMARLTTNRDGTDFIGVELPKEFVADVLDAALDTGRVTDETAAEGYGFESCNRSHPWRAGDVRPSYSAPDSERGRSTGTNHSPRYQSRFSDFDPLQPAFAPRLRSARE